MNKLIDQTDAVVNGVKQSNKCLTSFERKTQEELEKISSKIANHTTAMNNMVTAITGLQQKVKGVTT